MSKLQVYENAIETFQLGGANAPILYSTTEVNEKGFKVLADRKLKLRSKQTTAVVAVCALIIIATSVAAAIFGHPGAAPAPVVFFPLFIVFINRPTLIAINDDSLDFYILEIKFGSKYMVSDKFSLPYSRIDNTKVKAGRFNTSFRFEFSNEDKIYKIKTYVPNKSRKMKKQAENLKQLLKKVS